MKKINLKQPFLLVLTAFILGIAFVAQSVSMDYIGPFTFNCVRNLIGGLVLLPCIALLNRITPDATSRQLTATPEGKRTLLRGGLACGMILFAASNLQQIGIQYTTVGKAGFITALYIILVPIFSLFLKKKCGVNVLDRRLSRPDRILSAHHEGQLFSVLRRSSGSSRFGGIHPAYSGD